MLLQDMEYHRDLENPEHGGANERYIGYLDNGDLVELSHHGYYASRTEWEWAVFVPEDYPVQCYQRTGRWGGCQSAEEALADFEARYQPRTWRTVAEQRTAGDDPQVRCRSCGWQGSSFDLESETVYEGYGDVSCARCPSCGRVELDGDELFEEIS